MHFLEEHVPKRIEMHGFGMVDNKPSSCTTKSCKSQKKERSESKGEIAVLFFKAFTCGDILSTKSEKK